MPVEYKAEDFQKAREQFRELTPEDFQKVREQFEKLTPEEYARVVDAMYKAGDRCNFANIQQILELLEIELPLHFS